MNSLRNGKQAARKIACTAALAWASVAGLTAGPDFEPGQLLVRFKASAPLEAASTFARQQALVIAQKFPASPPSRTRGPLVLYQSSDQSTARMQSAALKNPEVLYAEPNYLRRLSGLPNDPDFGLLWGLHNTGQSVNGITGTLNADVNYPEAWALSDSPELEIVVGVADTGLSIGHPDLIDNLWTHPGEVPENGIDDDGNGYIDDAHGYDFGTDTFQMVDNDGHGTHVAGTIGASANNGIGITGVHGSVQLLPLKIEAENGALYTSDIIEAFLYAAALRTSGVNLVAVNASFGGPSYSQAEYDAIDEMNAAGVILCAAAGNESANNDVTASYPANYALPNILSVAASDAENELASFSNYGSTTVDLAAPGVHIYSTLPLNLIAYTASLVAGGVNYPTIPLEHSGLTPESGLSGAVIDCGIGAPEDFPPEVVGQIAFILRGDLSFGEKVANATAAGAIAAIVYNHENRPPGTWTLGYEANWIPALQLTKSLGDDLFDALPLQATLTNTGDLNTAYQFLNGTSMATPHVTGAVAFAALNFPNDSTAERISRLLDTVTPVPALDGLVATGGVLNLQSLVDTDNDQLGDWWEQAYFGNLDPDGSGNLDGDPYSDLEEFISMTDPSVGSQFLSLSATEMDPISGAALQFQSAWGRSYQILWKDDLSTGTWEILQTIEGDGSLIEVADPGAAGQDHRFYKLQILD